MGRRKDGTWYGNPDRPSWCARARIKSLTKAVNKLQWWGYPMPKEWADMSFAEQLAWARNRLRELAEGADNEKVQSMAAAALARSLEAQEPRANAKASPEGSVGVGALEAKSTAGHREYLQAIVKEANAELEKLGKPS